MMETNIKLKWTSHQGTVLSVFDTLLSTESLVDVTLACEGQYIRAHKMILSACSPYFQELINVDVNKHPIFFLKDVKFTQLKALIHYMYHGEVSIAQEDYLSVIAVAQALKIRGLADLETGINSIPCDILPDIGIDTNTFVKPPPPPPPVGTVLPPVVTTPIVRRVTDVPRTYIQDQKHFLVSQLNSSATPNIPVATVTVPTGAHSAHSNRVETRVSLSQTPQVQIKLSRILDPLGNVQSTSVTASSQDLDPFQTTSLPSASCNYESQGHSHSQDTNYGHTGIVEDSGLLQPALKLEAIGAVDNQLDMDEETSTQASFSDPWQLGECDKSGVAEDGEMDGGSGGGDDGSDGGEDTWVSDEDDDEGKDPSWNSDCKVLGKSNGARGRSRKTHWDHDSHPNEGYESSTSSCPENTQQRKRQRTCFRESELRTLNIYFGMNPNPDTEDIVSLSEKTGLSTRVLRTWFQNTRAKSRRNESSKGSVSRGGTISTRSADTHIPRNPDGQIDRGPSPARKIIYIKSYTG